MEILRNNNMRRKDSQFTTSQNFRPPSTSFGPEAPSDNHRQIDPSVRKPRSVFLPDTSFKPYNTINMSSPIGFIGLGIMGQGMAGRLLSENVAGSADVPLIVWNRTSSKCEELKERFPDKNIIVKDSAKEVVESCCVTL